MPIIFKDSQPEAKQRGEATDSIKRRLRRTRISAAKTGVIMAYEPVTRPVVDPDAPKMTKTAKRMARKRKKFAGHMAELGLTVEEGAANYFKSDKKRRKKNSATVVVGVEKDKPSANGASATEKTVTGSKHIKFGSDAEEQPEKTPSKPEKKKRKKKKVSKGTTPPDTIEADADTCQEETPADLSPSENKVGDDDEVASEETKPPNTPGGEAKAKKGKKVKKQRFILFVGNLSYDITEAEIAAHFVKVGKIVSVRIARHMEESMQGKSKGFAHLEVADEEAYLKALSMHQSFLRQRRINVEFSSSQTKDMRRDQKQRTLATKNAIATGDYLELINPSETKKKQHNRRNQRNQMNQERQTTANKIWL